MATTIFLLFLKNHYNISVKTIESDNEITTVKPDVERWLATQGIKVEPLPQTHKLRTVEPSAQG
ncbi:hypothetical protein P3342_004806 [Pyrenophora teres f. teres]|nr:hypothetical protein P3342_004806 [Pyrenophora teres f. teres]